MKATIENTIAHPIPSEVWGIGYRNQRSIKRCQLADSRRIRSYFWRTLSEKQAKITFSMDEGVARNLRFSSTAIRVASSSGYPYAPQLIAGKAIVFKCRSAAIRMLFR